MTVTQKHVVLLPSSWITLRESGKRLDCRDAGGAIHVAETLQGVAIEETYHNGRLMDTRKLYPVGE